MAGVGLACGSAPQNNAAESMNGVTVTDAAAPQPIAVGADSDATMAVYLTIANANAVDTLDGITTPVARTAALHTEVQHGGMATMMAAPSLPIPSHGEVRFSPGVRHIMLEGLTRLPRAGDTISVTLHFRRAGGVTVRVPIVRYDDLDNALGVGSNP